MLRASCRDGFNEWNLIYQKFLKKFSKLEQLYDNGNDNNSNSEQQQLLIHDVSELLKNLVLDTNDKKSDVMKFILLKINSIKSKNLREALFIILTMVRDKHKEFTKEFTKQWLMQNNTDLNRILNEPFYWDYWILI